LSLILFKVVLDAEGVKNEYRNGNANEGGRHSQDIASVYTARIRRIRYAARIPHADKATRIKRERALPMAAC